MLFLLNDCTLYGCMFSVDVAAAAAADVVVDFLSCHSLLHFILALFDIQPVSQPAKIRWHLHSFSSCSDFQMLLLYLQQLSGSNRLEIKQSTAHRHRTTHIHTDTNMRAEVFIQMCYTYSLPAPLLPVEKKQQSKRIKCLIQNGKEWNGSLCVHNNIWHTYCAERINPLAKAKVNLKIHEKHNSISNWFGVSG